MNNRRRCALSSLPAKDQRELLKRLKEIKIKLSALFERVSYCANKSIGDEVSILTHLAKTLGYEFEEDQTKALEFFCMFTSYEAEKWC